MRIAREINLTIVHLRHRIFGPGRFDGPASRFRHAPLPLRLANAQTVQAPNRALSIDRHHPSVSIKSLKPQPWPYDTAFPTGLPKHAVFPGQQLTDLPSTGGLLAVALPTNSKLLSSTQAPLTNPSTGSSDHLGKLIDVFA